MMWHTPQHPPCLHPSFPEIATHRRPLQAPHTIPSTSPAPAHIYTYCIKVSWPYHVFPVPPLYRLIHIPFVLGDPGSCGNRHQGVCTPNPICLSETGVPLEMRNSRRSSFAPHTLSAICDRFPSPPHTRLQKYFPLLDLPPIALFPPLSRRFTSSTFLFMSLHSTLSKQYPPTSPRLSVHSLHISPNFLGCC